MINYLVQDTWITKTENVLFHGTTSTGKTWLSCDIGIQVCRMGVDTFFIKASQLFEDIRKPIIKAEVTKLQKKINYA